MRDRSVPAGRNPYERNYNIGYADGKADGRAEGRRLERRALKRWSNEWQVLRDTREQVCEWLTSRFKPAKGKGRAL